MILKERLNKVQVITILLAFLGLFIILGGAVRETNFSFFGLGFGILSGLLYASLVLLNRKIVTAYDSLLITLIQMISAVIILLPFVLTPFILGVNTINIRKTIIDKVQRTGYNIFSGLVN